MKILFVQKIIGVAGSENYLLNILPGLQTRGFIVDFISLVPINKKGREEEFNSLLAQQGIKLHTVYYQFPYLSALSKINRIIIKGKYDLVHSHLIHADFFLALTKKFFNRKMMLVSTKHGYEEKYINSYGFDAKHSRKNIYWTILRWSERSMNRSFAISKSLQSLFVGLNICNRDKIDIIHYGFTFANEPELDSSIRYSENQLVLVGRLTEFKGHRFALEAVALLKERIPDIKLIIVGSGDLESDLNKLVVELRVESHIVFYGYHPNGRQFMYNSDVVLIPSVAEGFGVVVLEAFSVRRPIVAFNVPSLNEHIKHNNNGILVKPYDVESYASSIELLLNDKNKREMMADKAYELLISYYSQARMLDETIDFYQRVLNHQ